MESTQIRKNEKGVAAKQTEGLCWKNSRMERERGAFQSETNRTYPRHEQESREKKKKKKTGGGELIVYTAWQRRVFTTNQLSTYQLPASMYEPTQTRPIH